MPTEPSSQAIESPPQGVDWRYPLLSVAGVALYFCWPVVIHACLPFLRDFDAIRYTLLAAGSLLWLASCFLASVLLFRAAMALRPTRPIIAAVGWLLGWPLLVIAGVWLQVSIMVPDWFAPYFPWLGFYLGIPGTMLWLEACRHVYDALFTIMESRWPATKWIREIVSGLLRSLLHHHHSS